MYSSPDNTSWLTTSYQYQGYFGSHCVPIHLPVSPITNPSNECHLFNDSQQSPFTLQYITVLAFCSVPYRLGHLAANSEAHLIEYDHQVSMRSELSEQAVLNDSTLVLRTAWREEVCKEETIAVFTRRL